MRSIPFRIFLVRSRRNRFAFQSETHSRNRFSINEMSHSLNEWHAMMFSKFSIKKVLFFAQKKWFNNWLVSEPFTWGKTLGDKMNANDIFNHCSSRDLRSIAAEWKRRNLITALESLRNLIWTARTETSGTRTKNSFHFSCLFMSSANEWRGDERTENNILTRLFNFERKAEGKNINKRWMRPKLQKTNRC